MGTDIIQIYNHNISGGISKITNINHKLATTHFDLITLQETWFNDKINSNELIHSSDFNAFRTDRDLIMNNRKRGGGVITIINKELSVINIDINPTTIADTKITLIRKNKNDLIIVNTYWLPQGDKIALTNELIQNLRKIKTKFVDVPFMVIGYFNVGIKWVYSDEHFGYLIPSNDRISKGDKYFYQNLSDIGLYQLNGLPNSRGNFLDLIFSSELNNTNIVEAGRMESFDKNSINHNGISIETNFRIINEIKSVDLFKSKTNLRRFELNLNNTILPPFDINYSENLVNENINEIAEKLTGKIFALQNSSTTTQKAMEKLSSTNHSFTRNKTYQKLRKERDYIKKIHRQLPSSDSKLCLKLANQKNTTYYVQNTSII